MREMVEVTAKILEVRERSVKVTDGTMKEFTNKHTGEISQHEVWIFLPLSQIDCDEELEVGKVVTLRVADWIAEEKGLV